MSRGADGGVGAGEGALHDLASRRLTLPNLLTIGRLLLSPLLFWAVLSAEDTLGASWLAAGLGTFMAASDTLDGRLARRSVPTRWGAFLDPLADKVVVLGTMFCLLLVSSYHWLPVGIVTIRELSLTVIRSHFARQGLSMPARKSGKWKAFIQGVALLIALLPGISEFRPLVAGSLWIAVILTVGTGVQYVADGRGATSTTGVRS